MENARPLTVWVARNCRGAWEVELPDRTPAVAYESLPAARRVAYLFAAGRHPCELIVRDAYHRVVHRELVD